MRWSWHDLESVPEDVYDVLVEQLTREAKEPR